MARENRTEDGPVVDCHAKSRFFDSSSFVSGSFHLLLKLIQLFFQAQTFDFDLSLIKLSQSTSLTVACMPPVAPAPGLYCRVSGWGQVKTAVEQDKLNL